MTRSLDLAQFENFAALIPQPLVVVDGATRILATNALARKVLSLGTEPLHGRRLTDLTAGPPDNLIGYVRMCSRSRQSLPGVLILPKEGGGEIRYQVQGALLSEDPEPTERVGLEGPAVLLRLHEPEGASRFGLLTEKIDQLTAEVGRRMAAEEALREREERLRVVLTSIGDAVVVTDEAGNVSFLNPVAEKLTGWPQAEAAGRPLGDVFVIINEQTRSAVESPADRALREGTIVGLANHTLLVSRDGAHIPIDDSAAPLRTPGGGIDGVVLVFRAILERKQAERERESLLEREKAARIAAEQAQVEAERAHRAKDEFLAMLGHELRNPLAPIVAALDTLRSADQPTHEHARIVVERQIAHMIRLVDDLLDVARIARGKVELHKERLEISSAIEKAVEMTSPLLERAQQALTVSVPKEGLTIDGDATRLSQVISNLLTNASKFTPPGGKISLTAEQDGNEVVLRIVDSGIGISPEMLPRVFQMFVQETQSIARSQGGLGLGLAIAHNLVQAHGGSITAESRGTGEGSTFTIRLPRVRTEGQRSSAPPPRLAVEKPASLQVLIVDDHEDAATMLGLMLRRLGHTHQMAHDGETALGALDSFTPDVALLDIGLPDMDGYELAKRIRAKMAEKGIKLIALTGYGQESDRRKAYEAGFDIHLVKPLSRATLEATLAQLAAEKQ